MILEEYMDSLGEDAWLFEDLEADTFRNSFVFVLIPCPFLKNLAVFYDLAEKFFDSVVVSAKP